MVDMVNNEKLHAVILGFLAKNKLIAGEWCYGVPPWPLPVIGLNVKA